MKISDISIVFVFIAIIFGSCSTLGVPSGYTPYNQDTENIYIRNDEFKDISFIQHKYFFNKFIDLPISLYIAKSQNTKYLRAEFSYEGSDWIFFDSAIIVNSNGERISWTFKSYDKDTHVGSGGYVYESIDILLSADEVSKLLSLVEGNDVKIRLSGKYYKEFALDEKYIDALKEILKLFVNI